VKERPILFGAPMVLAILAGQKTQTRRVVKGWGRLVTPPESHPFTGELVGDLGYPASAGQTWAGFAAKDSASPIYLRCPFGQPGDRLWVRETWAPFGPLDQQNREQAPPGSVAMYRAGAAYFTAPMKWRPSIHMPRWASRITLEVTGVRIERLWEISEDDAKAEGVARELGRDVPAAMGGGVNPWRDYEDEENWYTSAGGSFGSLWRSINGRESWTSNPWVWVVEFKRLT
jgi:hypothetical protein